MMVEALDRLGVPAKVIRVISALYGEPKFRIRDRQGNSIWRRQRAGIRQGCPLSPYLFVRLMTVIFDDIHWEANSKLNFLNQFGPLDVWELMYADDTMLVGTRAREINILLAGVEK